VNVDSSLPTRDGSSARSDSSRSTDAGFGDSGVAPVDPDSGFLAGDGSAPGLDASAGSGCDDLGGFRVCGPESECSIDCPFSTECREGLGVCRPAMRDSQGHGDGCEFVLDTTGVSGLGWTGNPCAVLDPAQDGSHDRPYSGVGMPPSYCAAALDSGVRQRCVYADGTVFREGPPTASCPSALSSEVQFCGGACAGVECPFVWDRGQRAHACAGLSEDRGYGVCVFGRHRCSRANVSSRLDECESWYGRPCVCMVPVPSPVDNLGFPVLQEICQRYSDDYPSHLRCLNRVWTER